MQIKYSGKSKFEVRTKDIKIDFDNDVLINGFHLPGPGEYEKNGIFIEGISDNGNTIYIVKAEEINLCYLGRISRDLKESETKEIGDVDILFVPLGEENTLPVKKSLQLISKIDPKIVIPMLYSDEALLEFKKSEAITDGESDSLKIKRGELPVDERKNIILAAS